jgi:hypothetical protein
VLERARRGDVALNAGRGRALFRNHPDSDTKGAEGECMTVLVLKHEDSRLAFGSWNAMAEGGTTIINIPDSPVEFIVPITFDDFLALIAEGGKIVDLRKLQEEK